MFIGFVGTALGAGITGHDGLTAIGGWIVDQWRRHLAQIHDLGYATVNRAIVIDSLVYLPLITCHRGR
jgi:hypothetical protein